MANNTQVLSVQEAIDILGISRASLYKWMNRKPPKIFTVLIAGHRCVPMSEVQRLLNDRT